MQQPILYKGFNIKKRIDHNTETLKFVGTMQGLRLTADTLTALKIMIDERDQLRAEITRMEFKRQPRKGVAFTDYSAMYVEAHEVNHLVSRVSRGEVFHAL